MGGGMSARTPGKSMMLTSACAAYGLSAGWLGERGIFSLCFPHDESSAGHLGIFSEDLA